MDVKACDIRYLNYINWEQFIVVVLGIKVKNVSWHGVNNQRYDKYLWREKSSVQSKI